MLASVGPNLAYGRGCNIVRVGCCHGSSGLAAAADCKTCIYSLSQKNVAL